MKQILLVKTSSMGDVIHNCPVVNDILQAHPDAKIDWVVEDSFVDIPRLHPNVNQVFTVDMRDWRQRMFDKNTWAEIKKCKQALSATPYDFIIDAQGLIKSALVSTWAKGRRHGYDKASIREPFASYFYHQKHAISYDQHAVTRNRTLAAMSLAYPIPNTPPDYGLQTTHHVALNPIQNKLRERYVIALHGTSKASKLWPETQWVILGRALEIRNMQLVLPWFNDSEHKRALAIASQLSNALVLPKLALEPLARLIAQSTAAVGVDTGLSHLSAALNIPTVAIYTDSNPERTGVMAGLGPAMNLGGRQQSPSVSVVLNTLLSIATL